MLVFYSHVNYSVTKMQTMERYEQYQFYSHVNYSVTKIVYALTRLAGCFTVT